MSSNGLALSEHFADKDRSDMLVMKRPGSILFKCIHE